jgi:hypothetical protein
MAKEIKKELFRDVPLLKASCFSGFTHYRFSYVNNTVNNIFKIIYQISKTKNRNLPESVAGEVWLPNGSVRAQGCGVSPSPHPNHRETEILFES